MCVLGMQPGWPSLNLSLKIDVPRCSLSNLTEHEKHLLVGRRKKVPRCAKLVETYSNWKKNLVLVF